MATLSVGKTIVTASSTIGDAITDVIGFYGVTPVAQIAAAAQGTVATTAITTAVSTSVSGTIGFTSTAQGDAVVAAVNSLIARVDANVTLTNRIRADLVTLGIIKGAA